MSDGSAITVGELASAWGHQPNQIMVNSNDGPSGQLLWNYNLVATGSIGNSPENIMNALMRNASRKFPYTPTKS
jgi:hypothetical protein